MPKYAKPNVSMLTTRFTTETFAENKRYRENNQIKCIYSTSLPISDKLPYQEYYVLEMNNSTNKIIGIGKISKKLQPIAQIYSYKYYNRYTYMGTQYASIDDLESEIMKEIIIRIEKKIFYGRGHLKRGSSYTSFPAYSHIEDISDLITVFDYITRHKANE